MDEQGKTLIKEYIDKNCEQDKVQEAGEYWNKLESYITKQAREYLNGTNGMIADSIVFNWVYDFFRDEAYKQVEEAKPIAKEIPQHMES